MGKGGPSRKKADTPKGGATDSYVIHTRWSKRFTNHAAKAQPNPVKKPTANQIPMSSGVITDGTGYFLSGAMMFGVGS